MWLYPCLEEVAGASLIAVFLFLLEVSRLPLIALDRPFSFVFPGGCTEAYSYQYRICGFSAISMTSFLELYLNPFNVRRCFAISVNTSTIAYPLNLDLELKCTCVLEFSLREGVVLSPRRSFISSAVVSVVIFPIFIFVFL